MKKKMKLKSYVLPTMYVILFIATFYVTLMVSNSLAKKLSTTTDDKNKVPVKEVITDKPVLNETDNKMGKPYTNESVKIGKYYYDYKADSNKQQNSITYHDNTYMQNSGVDYILEESFDVVSVLDGTVTNVKTDDLLGKVVEIKHDNNYVSIYQSLSNVSVKKGDTVKKGQVIGKSGTNELDKDMGNHLHFELYVNGGSQDPTLYIDKELATNKNNDKNNNTSSETTNENNR